jgi:hypothetical protein
MAASATSTPAQRARALFIEVSPLQEPASRVQRSILSPVVKKQCGYWGYGSLSWPDAFAKRRCFREAEIGRAGHAAHLRRKDAHTTISLPAGCLYA